MQKFTVHTGRVAPLRRSDVDTDQIIPAVWLKQVSRTGFGAGLFSAWREADPDFVLNRPEYAGVSVLVAGPDFGTGSSREHAVWALQDFGFRVVLAPRFGDIFRGNSLKSGLLTVLVDEGLVEQLWARAEADPSCGGHGRPGDAGGALRRPRGALRARRLHPLAAAERAGRHRADAAAHRRGGRLRDPPAGLPAHHAAGALTPGVAVTRWDAELYAANTAHHRQHDAELLRGLTLPPRARVLDVGCGVGDFTARLAELGGGEVLGVDADPDMVATATRRQGADRLRFAVGRAQELDRLVPAGSVDAVFSVAALHWVPAAEHPTVLAQVRKVLRASGFVRAQFGGSGQIAALRAILDEESARLGGGRAGWFFPTAAEYERLLAAAGLTTGAGGWVRLLDQRRSFPTADALAGYLRQPGARRVRPGAAARGGAGLPAGRAGPCAGRAATRRRHVRPGLRPSGPARRTLLSAGTPVTYRFPGQRYGEPLATQAIRRQSGRCPAPVPRLPFAQIGHPAEKMSREDAVNKAQLVEALSARLGEEKKRTAATVDALLDTVYRTVQKGEKVALTGFGVFEKRDRAARTARNPATGEKVKVKKTSVPAFRAGQEFKNVVNGSKKLPKVAPAAVAKSTSSSTAPALPPAARRPEHGEGDGRTDDRGEEHGHQGAGEDRRRQGAGEEGGQGHHGEGHDGEEHGHQGSGAEDRRGEDPGDQVALGAGGEEDRRGQDAGEQGAGEEDGGEVDRPQVHPLRLEPVAATRPPGSGHDRSPGVSRVTARRSPGRGSSPRPPAWSPGRTVPTRWTCGRAASVAPAAPGARPASVPDQVRDDPALAAHHHGPLVAAGDRHQPLQPALRVLLVRLLVERGLRLDRHAEVRRQSLDRLHAAQRVRGQHPAAGRTTAAPGAARPPAPGRSGPAGAAGPSPDQDDRLPAFACRTSSTVAVGGGAGGEGTQQVAVPGVASAARRPRPAGTQRTESTSSVAVKSPPSGAVIAQ